jgi:hypothetical protein
MVAVGELQCGGGVVDLCVETWIFGVIFESEASAKVQPLLARSVQYLRD